MRYDAPTHHSPHPLVGNPFLHVFPKQRMDVGSIPVAISNTMKKTAVFEK